MDGYNCVRLIDRDNHNFHYIGYSRVCISSYQGTSSVSECILAVPFLHAPNPYTNRMQASSALYIKDAHLYKIVQFIYKKKQNRCITSQLMSHKNFQNSKISVFIRNLNGRFARIIQKKKKTHITEILTVTTLLVCSIGTIWTTIAPLRLVDAFAVRTFVLV